VPKPKKTEKPAAPRSDEDVTEGTEQEQLTDEAAERKFVEDTLIRGEAAKPDEAGKLPPDATHEIVEEHEGEPPTIRRRRFKAF
jgi:hypothetical protein